jgi:alkylation response protein AidB-like acyl-CoA dehydrogenase
MTDSSDGTESPQPDPGIWAEQVRAWFEGNFSPHSQGDSHRQTSFAVFHDLDVDAETALLERIRAYRRLRYDAGYGALTLPVVHGGAGLPPSYTARFHQIESGFEVPESTELISVTTGLVAPSVALFGSEEVRAELLASLLRTDVLACQLFSEPGAGSDLASVSCKATPSDVGWVLRGQKVWTSGARFADYGLLLARTDPDVPKHAGITAFLVPMNAPGITIRPIRQMSGGTSFNEVFIDDAVVADHLRVGAVNDGWKVATTTLAFERQASGSGTRRKGGTVADLIALAKQTGATEDPTIRNTLVDLHIRSVLKQATTERAQRAALAGQSPGPAGSVGKLISSDLLVRIGECATDILGPRLAADHGDGGFAWAEHVLGAPGYRLAGGTDQIQRNIIAERVLGLPPEPRVDKDVPFSRLAGR